MDTTADQTYRAAFEEINAKMLRVEFVWHSKVDLLFFPKPSCAKVLSQNARERLLQEVPVSESQAKQRWFLTRSIDLVEEMRLSTKLSDSYVFRLFSTPPTPHTNISNGEFLRYTGFLFSILLNVLLGLSVKAVSGPWEGEGNSGFPFNPNAVIVQVACTPSPPSNLLIAHLPACLRFFPPRPGR